MESIFIPEIRRVYQTYQKLIIKKRFYIGDFHQNKEGLYIQENIIIKINNNNQQNRTDNLNKNDDMNNQEDNNNLNNIGQDNLDGPDNNDDRILIILLMIFQILKTIIIFAGIMIKVLILVIIRIII